MRVGLDGVECEVALVANGLGGWVLSEKVKCKEDSCRNGENGVCGVSVDGRLRLLLTE